MAMVLTYERAMASARDAARGRASRAGRTKWSRADYNHAVATFDRLMTACYGADRACWPTPADTPALLATERKSA